MTSSGATIFLVASVRAESSSAASSTELKLRQFIGGIPSCMCKQAVQSKPNLSIVQITQGHHCGGGLLILCGDVKAESLEVNSASDTAPRTLFDNTRT
jgi:hypothetical protein